MTMENIGRREILKGAAALGVTAALARGTKLLGAEGPAAAKMAPTVGIQMNVAALAAPDLRPMLEDLKTRAGVNALFPFIYSNVSRWYGNAGPGFVGGNFAIPHMQYYKDTSLTYKDMRATELGDLDVLEHTIAAAKPLGMKTFAWILENNESLASPAWEPLYEMDFHGRRTRAHPSGPCNNNPAYIGYLLGLVEDYARSYDIDGVMWSSERQGGCSMRWVPTTTGRRRIRGRRRVFANFA